jgi:AcrR family transcriptional regulator
MAIRQRAIQAEDKQERYHAILDAAERLLERVPDRMPSVADVADDAGLAKGTVYLYFASKDELLLALHERHIDDFFRALVAALERAGPVTIDGLLALVQTYIVGRATFLPLATRCFGLMATDVSPDAATAFRGRMYARLDAAGGLLERHFPHFAPGDGLALLRHSYALILGLWQMSASGPTDPSRVADSCAIHPFDYPAELGRALRHLWEGTVGGPLPMTPALPAKDAA